MPKTPDFCEDEDAISSALMAYAGVDGLTIDTCCHPDHIWTILDHMDTLISRDEELTSEQKRFLTAFIQKWMQEISPYCVKLECA